MRAQDINPAILAMLFRKDFQMCNVNECETIAILSDIATRRDFVMASFAAAEDLGANIYEVCVNEGPSWVRVGIETVGA